MGILSASSSITLYKTDGELQSPILESVTLGLKKNAIKDIDKEPMEKAFGWTSFEDPFNPDFDGSSFSFGTHWLFSMRIDKKTIPTKVLKKYVTQEMKKRLAESGRDSMSRNEKKQIREQIQSMLLLQIPATPNIYEVLWNYEENKVWFYTNLKAANEDLETLFTRSFDVRLIRLFPYTMGELMADLTASDRDVLSTLNHTSFLE